MMSLFDEVMKIEKDVQPHKKSNANKPIVVTYEDDVADHGIDQLRGIGLLNHIRILLNVYDNMGKMKCMAYFVYKV